jgi:hypothetical protein
LLCFVRFYQRFGLFNRIIIYRDKEVVVIFVRFFVPYHPTTACNCWLKHIE